MVLRVKNMVCDRCVKVVKETAAALGIADASVGLGYIDIPGELDEVLMRDLEAALEREGFFVLEDGSTR